ncbi:pectinesterase family protein [Kineococcus glutinatus]|uniref:Pectate lyase domain-containing protein n=1 Tax=Kineococcus glutinatus TaxID=1070872 RepID=A0ABP9HUE2_9ACTN
MPFPAPENPRRTPPPGTRGALGRAVRTLTPALALALGLGLTGAPASAGAQPARAADRPPAQAVAPEREPLAASDGWASAEGGTRGGSDAAPGDVVDVRTRDELAAALSGDHPKIVRVVADIDAATLPDGTRTTCEDYARDGYTLADYLHTYDPARWSGAATGPLEDARKASSAAQGERIKLRVPSNTTLIGVGDVTLTGFAVTIDGADDVIVRNLHISDAYDCFPGWNGDTWKTEWDNLVVSGSTHVWLDHLTLDDGDTADSEQPVYFGERFLRHDGLLDVVRAADLVTISWNRLVGHDKSMLWGNGDGAVADRGKLRVTLHHNEMVDLVQRAPRVRFGQAHVYDNVYRVSDPENYQYSWGVGVESSIIARENTFELADGIGADRIVHDWGGTGIDAAGTWVNGRQVDVLAAYNRANPGAPLAPTVTGTAGPHLRIEPAPAARRAVAAHAGAGRPSRGAAAPTSGEELLRLMRAPDTRTADGPVWSLVATGFAATPADGLPIGTTGGQDGPTVTVTDAAALAHHAALPGAATILVRGRITVDPFGSMIRVGDDKTIAGVGDQAEIVGGGLFLDGSSNVVVRNLRFRDSYVPGDWDGKSADNDNDGIRLDGASNVWIDHNEFTRLGDGLVDVRKDSTAVTLSWNVFRDHNKAVGVGWTPNVVTTVTMHHNWFSNTFQRNASIDNTAAAHLYNNYLDGIGQYGTMSRGAAQVLVESSVYANGEDAVVAKDPASRVESRDNLFTEIRGRKDSTGATFDPRASYPYTPDPVGDVQRVVTAGAGPLVPDERVGRTVRVALDGTGDFASITAAVGAAERADHPVEIVVAPGTYREVVRVRPAADHVRIRGGSGRAQDVVLTYDVASGQQKFYGGTFGSTGSPTLAVLAGDATLADVTVENAYDEAANGGSQALALRTTGDRVVLDGVRLLGNQDTYLADTPNRDTNARVYVRDSYVEGDVDFVYGRATAVFERSTLRSLDRGQAVNGYVTAASTTPVSRGFLFVRCRFESDAAAGTVFLGRPWHPSSNPVTDPAVVVRDSWLGGHVATPAWADMSGWSWRDAEFAEYSNSGPGAVRGQAPVDGRPQLSRQQAAQATPAAYLSGTDGWSPRR